MASRIEYAVNVTPIYTATNAEMNDTDVIAKDINKSLGGNGSIAVTWGTTNGYSAGAPSYKDGNGGTIAVLSGKFLFIKHTGYTLVTGALGVVTASTLTISIGSETGVLKLSAGEAICLPLNTYSGTITLASSSGTIAVEYFWV